MKPSLKSLIDEDDTPELIFSHGMTSDVSHIIFIFNGPKEEVKKIVRNALYGGVVAGMYSRNKHFEELAPAGIQYEIFISKSAFHDLTNMLWYIAKVTGYQADENAMREMFAHDQNIVSYSIGNKFISARLSFVMYEAALAAKLKKDDPLIIKNHHQPNDRSLWTAEELQALEDEIALFKKQENAKKVCQYGIFGVTLTAGIVAMATAVYKKSW